MRRGRWRSPLGRMPASSGALIVVALTLAVGCGGGEEPAEAPPAEEPAPVEAPPEPPPPPPKRAPAPPATGTLEVVGTEGAAVFLDGEPVGTVPGVFADLPAGEHQVRVERADFHPLEVAVTIRGGRSRTLDARLAERLGSIAVESEPAGAMVFVNRDFKGNTPVVIEDLRPDTYALMLSIEGFDVHNERVEVGRDPVPVRVEFVAPAAALDVSVEVVHKHRFGSCAGTLVATETGFDYRTEHRDAFELPFARVERFELDYVENNLRLKVRGGRTYNFEAPNGDVDPLFVFHRDVQAFREAGN